MVPSLSFLANHSLTAARSALHLLAQVGDVSAKATVVLIAAAVTVLVMRRTSASVKHLMWTLSVGGVLLLPLMSWWLPRVEVALLPAALEVPAMASDAMPTVVGNFPTGSVDRIEVLPARETASDSTRVGRWLPLGVIVPLWLAALWLSIAGVLLSRLVFERFLVAELAERSDEVTDQRLTLMRQLMARLGVERPVKLLESNETLVPATWGTLHPVVLLPEQSRSWPDERLQIALLHELAHVRRGDAATQLMAQIACAVFWFHPLMWLAARQMRRLREYACDDAVLESGTLPSSYASELLAMVREASRGKRPSAVTLGMASRSQLYERTVAILDAARARTSTVKPAMAFGCAAMVLLPLAVLSPTPSSRPNAPVAARATVSQVGQVGVVAIEMDDEMGGECPEASAMRAHAVARAVAPAAPMVPWAVVAGVGPMAAPSPVAAPAPVAAVAPVAPAAAAPAAPRAESRCSEHRHSVRTDSSKVGERIAAAVRDSKNDDDLANALISVADDERLNDEETRVQFVDAASKVRANGLRAQVLRTLLNEAPISENTGHLVLQAAMASSEDDGLAPVLERFHSIRERALVRGPLAAEYQQAAEKLKDTEALAEALQNQLHPNQVPRFVTVRALQLLSRVPSVDAKVAVLKEITDHQLIDPEINAMYRAVVAQLPKDEQEDPLDELAGAKHVVITLNDRLERDGRREKMKALAVEREALRAQARHLKEQAKALKQQLKAYDGSGEPDADADADVDD